MSETFKTQAKQQMAQASRRRRKNILPYDTKSILRFQKFHGLKPTGRIDRATLRKMRKTDTRLGRRPLPDMGEYHRRPKWV